MALSESEKDELAERFALELDKRRNVSESQHKEHHAFIQQWIDKEKRRLELLEKVKAQVIGWGVISALVGMVTALGLLVKDWMQRGNVPGH